MLRIPSKLDKSCRFWQTRNFASSQKVFASAAEATKDIKDGQTLLIGGFGVCGVPQSLIKSLEHQGPKNLICVSNNAGIEDYGLGLLLKNRQVKKMISSYVGENKEFER
jgi:acyl CoA:acetate/3-ketoacid CoA transferase alpha subunit